MCPRPCNGSDAMADECTPVAGTVQSDDKTADTLPQRYCKLPIGRLSSVVEQRFCKPLVGSSNLSAGNHVVRTRLCAGCPTP